MKRTLLIPLLLAAGASSLAACDDDTSSATPDMAVDMAIQMDMAPPPVDMATPDMDPDMNVVDAEIDAEVDAEVDAEIDAEVLLERGPACGGDDECGEEFQRCVDDLCSYDMLPDVFVVNDITVVEPAGSAELIQVFIRDAVADNLLNLLIEPGGYQDTGEYLWYIGNGGYRDGGEYEYLGNYPIQNFFGFWRNETLPPLLQEDGNTDPTLMWRPEEQVIFLLNVPTGSVDTPDGPVTCNARIPVTVNLALTPSRNEQGDPIMRAMVSGYLTADDADMVRFRIGGASVALTELLNDDDLEDTDGDGLNDAYAFGFVASAVPITFIGEPPNEDGSNRDPNPDFELPAECN